MEFRSFVIEKRYKTLQERKKIICKNTLLSYIILWLNYLFSNIINFENKLPF